MNVLAGLSGFAIFVAVSGLALSATMLLVPVIYDKYDRLVRLSRAMQEDRVHFILSATGVGWLLLIRFVARPSSMLSNLFSHIAVSSLSFRPSQSQAARTLIMTPMLILGMVSKMHCLDGALPRRLARSFSGWQPVCSPLLPVSDYAQNNHP